MTQYEPRSRHIYNEALGVYDVETPVTQAESFEAESTLDEVKVVRAKLGRYALKSVAIVTAALTLGYSGAHMAGNFTGTKLDDIQHFRIGKVFTELDGQGMLDDLKKDSIARLKGEK